MRHDILADHGPWSAFVLGWAGVIPFAGLAVATMVGVPAPVVPLPLLLGYGAVILSFMAGVQWGLTMRAPDGAESGWRGYAVSVLPALIAWPALFLPSRAALLTMAATFAALLAYDLWTLKRSYAPAWYGRLRWQLTAAVVVLLLATTARLSWP